MSTTISSWADLPIDMLTMIANCNKTRIDKTRFRSVCTSWRSSTPPFQNPFRLSIDLHLTTDPHSIFAKIPSFFHTTEKTIYCLEPVLQPSSSMNHPWLIVVEECEDGKVHLLNPFTGSRIKRLPSGFPTELDLRNFHIIELQKLYRLELKVEPENLRTLENFYVELKVDPKKQRILENKIFMVRKVVFLPNPTYDEPLLAVLQIFDNLSFFKLVNNEWILLHDIDNPPGFDDIASYKGKVCAIKNNGQAIIVDAHFNVTEISKPTFSYGITSTPYLVESSEDLYLVQKFGILLLSPYIDDSTIGNDMDSDEFFTLKVYKFHEEEHMWNEVTDLDGQVIFLGEEVTPHWSFCVSAHQISGCKKNCIFFTDDATYVPFGEENAAYIQEQNLSECYHALLLYPDYKLRVFDVETGRCGSVMHFPGYADMFWPPPNWLTNQINPSE